MSTTIKSPRVEGPKATRVLNTVFIALILSPFILIGLFMCIGFIILAACLSEIDASNADGPAPDGGYAVRRAWGEENLKHHFTAVDKWVRNSSEIAQDIGPVKGVAPIGEPNSFGASFGESNASMNLQVIGEHGEGILHLPDVCADDPRHLYGVKVNRLTWSFESTEAKP